MCPFTVRIPKRLCLADFLGSMLTGTIAASRRTWHTIGVLLGRWICLPSSAPTPFNRLFRQPAEVSLPRPRVARMASAGILTGSSICIALRLIIRVRLTPGRLTSPGNPWSCGGGESHPPYRYLCLHLLFQTLHGRSRGRFGADWNAPLPTLACPAASAHSFIPDYYPCPIPRLVSCYALFG